MRNYIYKTLIAVIALIFVFEFTIGRTLNKVIKQSEIILTKEGRKDLVNSIKEEMEKAVNIHGVIIRPRSREVIIDNKNINLTFTEFQILYLLALHPGWVFTRYQIIDKIRGDSYPVTDRSVDFQIVGLRKKIGEKGKLIMTIRGVGYKFLPDDT